VKRYMLTDGNGNYIRRDSKSNKYVPVNGLAYGDSWDEFKRAEKIRKSALGKELKRKYYSIVVEVPDKSTKQQKPDMQLSDVVEEIKAINDGDIETTIIEFLKCAETLFSKKDDLLAKQSSIDREVTDLQHYIEQKNLNAYEGYMAYKKLQSVLIRRRWIKDKLLILSIIEDCKIDPESISHTISRIQGLNGRKYKPRVLNEIFEKGIV